MHPQGRNATSPRLAKVKVAACVQRVRRVISNAEPFRDRFPGRISCQGRATSEKGRGSFVPRWLVSVDRRPMDTVGVSPFESLAASKRGTKLYLTRRVKGRILSGSSACLWLRCTRTWLSTSDAAAASRSSVSRNAPLRVEEVYPCGWSRFLHETRKSQHDSPRNFFENDNLKQKIFIFKA